MTKQEEIREVIDRVATGAIKPTAALRLLSDLGVVIKETEWCEDADHWCIRVKPLIEAGDGKP